MKNISLLPTLIVFTLFSCKSIPQAGLVGEYLFDKDVVDTSPYHLDGTAEGATRVDGHTGKGKSAYHFNGIDQFLTIPSASHNNFAYDTDFTISLWVRLDSIQTDNAGNINDILRKWRGDTQGYPFSISYINSSRADSLKNRFLFARYDGSICRNAPALYSPTYTTYTFSHLVFVRSGRLLKMYLNNQWVGEIQDTVLSAEECGSHNTCEITIGTRGNRVRYFSGSVDDVRFYSRALDKKEIAILFKN